jgi:transposase
MPDSAPHAFVGIDPALDSCAASIFHHPDQPGSITAAFANDLDGFTGLLTWLSAHQVKPDDALVCVEATGVYAEALCYYLHEHGFTITVESPHKVKRAFKTTNKNDPTDSRQIAEYAYRFFDQLQPWQPREAVLEQIRTLLTAREQFVGQLSQSRNMRHVLQRKVVQTPAANQALDETVAYLQRQIKAIEDEIRRLIRSDSTLAQMLTLLISIPSVGLLLSAHLMVITDGFQRQITARQLAAYIGICPYEHKSGKTVERPARSRGYGPPMLRKLLYLAALNLKQHSAKYQRYYARKQAEGKSGRLILNNLSNKLLRVICAVIREGQPYEESYRSVPPNLLRAA